MMMMMSLDQDIIDIASGLRLPACVSEKAVISSTPREQTHDLFCVADGSLK